MELLRSDKDYRLTKSRVEALVKEIGNMNPGDVIGYAQIGQWLDLDTLKERTYVYRLMRDVKKELLKDKRFYITTVHKVGYRIVKRGEEISVCEGEYAQGVKKIGRAVVKANMIPLQEIPKDEVTRTVDSIQKMSNIHGLLTAGA